MSPIRCIAAIAAALTALLVPFCASARDGSEGQPVSQQASAQLPAGKQTTLGLYVTAAEAYENERR